VSLQEFPQQLPQGRVGEGAGVKTRSDHVFPKDFMNSVDNLNNQ